MKHGQEDSETDKGVGGKLSTEARRERKGTIFIPRHGDFCSSFRPITLQKQFNPCHVFKIFRSQILDDIFK